MLAHYDVRTTKSPVDAFLRMYSVVKRRMTIYILPLTGTPPQRVNGTVAGTVRLQVGQPSTFKSLLYPIARRRLCGTDTVIPMPSWTKDTRRAWSDCFRTSAALIRSWISSITPIIVFELMICLHRIMRR